MIKINIDHRLRSSRHSTLRLIALMFLLWACLAGVSAQKKHNHGFDPKRFDAEMEQFITTEACLTPSQAAKFFPVYRKMMKKMRLIFDESRRMRMIDLTDNEACAKAINRQDELDIELKQLQQEYHVRFMSILPAGKVMQILKAEEKFHRQAFKKMK